VCDLLAGGPQTRAALMTLTGIKSQTYMLVLLKRLVRRGRIKALHGNGVGWQYALPDFPEPEVPLAPPRAARTPKARDRRLTAVVANVSRGQSWWVSAAAPDKREDFIERARQRDHEMRTTSATWAARSRVVNNGAHGTDSPFVFNPAGRR
jgi:hypothetical protein